jgi:hypothetical protein
MTPEKNRARLARLRGERAATGDTTNEPGTKDILNSVSVVRAKQQRPKVSRSKVSTRSRDWRRAQAMAAAAESDVYGAAALGTREAPPPSATVVAEMRDAVMATAVLEPARLAAAELARTSESDDWILSPGLALLVGPDDVWPR